MKITEIYKKYPINQGLQRHMVQVAAVAKQICDHISVPVDTHFVVSVCLVHDLGNLAKIKFGLGHDYHFEPEGLTYWQEKQTEVWETISRDEHEVTNYYLDDLGLSPEIKAAVNVMGLSELSETAIHRSTEHQIITYADMRVGLHGIVSAGERMADLKRRYVPERHTGAEIDECTDVLLAMERKLFAGSGINPADITDVSTAEIQKELLEWKIETVQ